MTLYVGTSGWAYKEWKPDFYPQGVPQTRFLTSYAEKLRAVEVNATFYRVQTDETVTKWQSFTSDGFRFAAKAHYLLTHRKKMAWDAQQQEFLHDFLRSLEPLGDRLGPVLLQHPPHRERDDDALDEVLEALPSRPTFVFEFRNETWNDDVVAKRIAEAGAALCVSDTTGEVPEQLPDGAVAYVRLRSERYSDEQRSGWLDLLQRESAARDVYAFTKHKGIPATDPYGGVGLARWLHEHAAG